MSFVVCALMAYAIFYIFNAYIFRIVCFGSLKLFISFVFALIYSALYFVLVLALLLALALFALPLVLLALALELFTVLVEPPPFAIIFCFFCKVNDLCNRGG